ncbi:MAG: hypothetical protein R3E32_15600 [Chitinophagales bacterium]
MSQHLLDNLRKNVWQKAFSKAPMPSKWRNNHAKDLQNKLYRELGQLLDVRLLLKFLEGKWIDEQSLNILAKYALFENREENVDTFSAKKTDYWQQFQNKELGIEEEEPSTEASPTAIEETNENAETTVQKPLFPTYTTFYWRRPIDEVLAKLLQSRSPIWVEGVALSGKSRAIWEALKVLKNVSVVLPDVKNLETAMPLPSIEAEKTVVYFDDLMAYYTAYSHHHWIVNQYLSQILERENTQVLVSNRTGLEATLMADYLPDALQQKFEKIEIPSITFDDIAGFQGEVEVRLDFNAFDDSMGSLLMGFSNVQKKYEQLANITDLGWNFSQKVADTAQDILFALKHLHHICHFHQAPNCFKVSLVRDFCLRLQGRKISQKQWQEALEVLEVLQQKTVRFLQWQDADFFQIDTTYLDCAIEPNLPNSDIVRKVKELYTTVEQRIENGFFLHPVYFSKRIYAQQFFEQAKQVLNKAIEEGLQPNAAVFTSLLRKTSNFEEAYALLQQIKVWKVKPDTILFKVLLSKTTNYQQSQQVYTALKTANIQPNSTFFNFMMAKADTYQQVLDLVADMKTAGIRPSTETFNALIAKADTHAKALQWRHTMQNAQCPPNLQTFLYLLQQSADFEGATEIWQQMTSAGFLPQSINFYHLYLQRAASLSQALKVKKAIAAHSALSLDLETFNILLLLAENDAQIQAFREEMTQLDISPNAATFAALIAQATDFEAALKLLQEMPAFGLKAATDSYNALLQQATDLDRAMGVFEQMHEQQIALNEDSFLILLDKTEGFEEGLRLLVQLQQMDYKAGRATYNRLIARAETIQPALQALRKMRQNGVVPDAKTYSILIGKVNDGNFKQAFNLFKTMKAEYIRPTEECYEALLEKIAGYEQAFVNQVLLLYPQTLNELDYHRIFAAILPKIDRHAFLKTAEEYIDRDEKIGELYG